MNTFKDHSFFKNFSKSESDSIFSECEKISFSKADILFRQGSTKFSGAIIIVDGEIECFQEKINNPISGYISNEFFNLSSILYSNERPFTAVVKKDTEILFLDKSKIKKLISNDSEIRKIFEKLSIEDYNASKLFNIFRNLYGEKMDFNAHKEIYKLGEWQFIEDNNKLFDINTKSDSFYFLVSGLLKAFIPIKDNYIQVGEINEGEVIGEMGIISDEPRSATIFATRDSLVFKLNIDVANRLIMKYPLVLLQVATKIADRLRKTQQENKNLEQRTDIFSLIPLSIGQGPINDLFNIGNLLVKSISRSDTCLFLSSSKINEMLNIENINDELRKDKYFPPLNDLIENIFKENRYLILSCDSDYTPWTFWCLSISDKQIFVVDRSEGISNIKMVDEINKQDQSIPDHLIDQKQLIVYHQSKKIFPERTKEILDKLPKISQHYHMAKDDLFDSDRVGRMIIKKGIGLCLSGGGAKGNAHIGVYKALIENKIPIDVVCGTSAGGIVGSLIAFGYDPETIVERLKQTYKRNSFKEYNIPVTSIIATKKIIEDAIWLGNDMDIEDLWIPYFSVAVNISKSTLDVIDKGPVYVATRATGALPGIVLPVIKDSSFLVDGGLINNMPGDIMVEKYGGKLISVNVSPHEGLDASFKDFPNQNRYFFKKLLKMKKNMKHELPALSNIIMRSIFVASSSKYKDVVNISDLFFDLNVSGVGLLEFDRIDDSVEFGYNHAMKTLEETDINKLLK